jgi:hypothetical protein
MPAAAGEADTPQHCDGCGHLLQNPLTWDGRTYVEGAIRCCVTTRSLSAATNNAVVVDWAEFYKTSSISVGSFLKH